MHIIKNVLVIACLTAGDQVDPQKVITQELTKKAIKYHYVVANTPPEIANKLQSIKLKNYDSLFVYGGDGTIITGIKQAISEKVPIFILPGGTANIMASYFNIKDSLENILRGYLAGAYTLETIGIASVNNEPMIVDMHTGIWSEAVKETPRQLKQKLGAVAYGLSAIKKLSSAKKGQYQFQIDGNSFIKSGYTLLIANQGDQHLLGVNIFPYKHGRGTVQVALIKSLKIHYLIFWLLLKKVTNRNFGPVIETYRGKQVTIPPAKHTYIIDDEERILTDTVTIQADTGHVQVAIPPLSAATSLRLHKKLQLFIYRVYQRLILKTKGRPQLESSHIAPGLYLGGQYRASAYQLFRQWGIKGIVNMRTTKPLPPPDDIQLLHLPTTDWQPPSLNDLAKGSAFIKRIIEAGGSVYIHCRLGEGRGPTMAAAYLISTGLTVEDALHHITKFRKVARPNTQQLRQLARWQQQCIG